MARFTRAVLLVMVATTLALTGCGSVDLGRTASGKTASQRLDVAGVTRLDVGSTFAVHVTLGQPEAATVTYDDNLADLLDVGVHGGTLHVRLKPHSIVSGHPTLRAEVTLRGLEGISAGGASTVDVANALQRSALRLTVSGSSRVTANLDLDQADATVSGASRLKLTGIAGTLRVDGSGASVLELAGLRLHDLDIQLSGASNADVQVDRAISAQLSGASHLTYQGTPQLTKLETSGASTIRPA